MSKDNVVSLVNWDSDQALGVAQQLVHHVQTMIQEGKNVGVVVCVVKEIKPGSNLYEPGFSVMPVECAAWAADMIKRSLMDGDYTNKPQT